MKMRKNLTKKVLSGLSLILFSLIPLFLNAQGTTVEVYSTDLDGRFHLESIIPDVRVYSDVIPEQMPGWPQSMVVPSYYAPSGVSLADVDEDGFLEIISACTDGSVHVWDYQGNELPGWPKTGLNVIQSKVAVGDIDPDYPGLEILVAGKLNKLYAWHNDGTTVTGWPLTIGETTGFKSPVLFDIDSDGFLEIILEQKIYPDGHVIVFNRDGTIYPGWPQPLDYLGVATPTVGDVDNDGEIEICAVSYYSVFLWDKDGVAKPGWPKLNVAGGMSYAQPVFADLDDDGDMEILHSYNTSNTNYVGIYHHDGSVFENWPQIYPGPQTYVMPITGDIDDDSDLEIFGGCHGYGILERHHNGDTVSGWPVDIYNIECSPIVFDLDNDGEREIIFGDNAGTFYAYNGDGSPVEDWPIPAGGNAMVNSAAVGDVDGDGDIEIALVVSNGTVNLWTLEDMPYRSYLTDWGTFYHDNWNTGWMHPSKPQNLTADISGNSVNLSWDANTEPDLAGYNIYKSDSSGGPYTKINSGLVTETIYEDVTGTENDFYCVTAEILARTESRLSSEVFFQMSSIEGTVGLNGGTGNVEDVIVTAGLEFASPDTSGFYSIEIEPGTYDVIATLDGYETDTVTNILVEEGQTTTGIDFTLYPSVGLEDYHLSSNKTLSNYPNPFNTETTITFSLTENTENAEILIFNIKGEKIKTLVSEKLNAGTHQAVWDGKDNSGKQLDSGVYLYQLYIDHKAVSIEQMILMN